MSKTLRIPRDVVTFHEVTPQNGDWSSALAVKVGERLTKARAQQLAAAVGYAWAQHMRGERLGAFRQHGHSTIVFDHADTTKTVRDDLGEAWEDFLHGVRVTITYGSPLRETNRRGPGTQGTRLVEGLGGVGGITVYADSVLT